MTSRCFLKFKVPKIALQRVADCNCLLISFLALSNNENPSSMNIFLVRQNIYLQ